MGQAPPSLQGTSSSKPFRAVLPSQAVPTEITFREGQQDRDQYSQCLQVQVQVQVQAQALDREVPTYSLQVDRLAGQLDHLGLLDRRLASQDRVTLETLAVIQILVIIAVAVLVELLPMVDLRFLII